MWIIAAAAAGLVGTVLALILKQYRPEFRMLVTILFKAVGICLLTQLAGDVCRDSGESSIASKIELAGRAAILLTAMPLIQEVLAWAWELMNL